MGTGKRTSKGAGSGSTNGMSHGMGRSGLPPHGGDPLRLREDLPPEVHERFLESLLALEEAEAVSLTERLGQAGLRLPPVEDLEAGELTDKLWEVIHALARLEVYLTHTDHLSDRELYEQLLEDLEEPHIPVPDGLFGCGILDFTGSGSPREVEAYLRYYADVQFRRQWAEELPDVPLPGREDPPFDRDRHLPRSGWNRPRGAELSGAQAPPPPTRPMVRRDVRGNVRRNAPCPCGSGRKAKRCCWRDGGKRGA